MRLLLAHCDAPEFHTSQATELWIMANSSGHEHIADSLLEYDAPVNMHGNAGSRALIEAVRLDQVTTVDRLVELDADVNREYSSPTLLTPLTKAIDSIDVNMVRKLIDYGADANYFRHTIHSFSPLCYASSRGNLDIFGLLIQNEHVNLRAVLQYTGSARSEIQVQVTIGDVALQLAVTRGHEEIFNHLWGHKTLRVAVDRNYCEPWVSKEPLLGTAAARGHFFIAKTIVAGARGKVDLSRTDLASVFLPLKQAARQGHTLFFQLLLQIGENETELEFGEHRADGTALWCAGDALSYEIAEMLLPRGAKTDM